MMHAEDLPPQAEESNQKEKSLYFRNLTNRYPREMRLLFRGGKLTGSSRSKKEEQWRNVAEHCTVQLAAAEVMSDLLQLEPEDKEKLCSVAAVHDWRKRMDVMARKIGKMPDGEEKQKKQEELKEMEEHAQQFFDASQPATVLMEATGPKFMEKVLRDDENISLLEKIQCYLDDICGDRPGDKKSDLLPLKERLQEVSARNPRPENETDAAGQEKYPELKQMLAERGKGYWEVETEFVQQVEKELWQQMGGRDVGIEKPEDLPLFLKSQLTQRMRAFALEQHQQREKQEKPLRYHIDPVLEDRRGDLEAMDERRSAPELNEDYVSVRRSADGRYIAADIGDGASAIGKDDVTLDGRTIKQVLGNKAPGKAASDIARAAIEATDVDRLPVIKLIRANEAMREQGENLPLTEDQKSKLLSVVALSTLLDTKTNILHYAAAGDCHLLTIDADGNARWHTKNTAAPFEKLEIAAGAWVALRRAHLQGKPESQRQEFLREQLPSDEVLLQNLESYLQLPIDERPSFAGVISDPRVEQRIEINRHLENDSEGKGYPSLKGSAHKDLLRYVQEGRIQMRPGMRAFLISDGLLPGPLDTPEQRAFMEEALKNGGIRGLHAAVRAWQENDPNWRNPPRFKQFDDAAGVEISATAI